MNYFFRLFVILLCALKAFDVSGKKNLLRPLAYGQHGPWTNCNMTNAQQILMDNDCKRLLICYQTNHLLLSNGTSKLGRRFCPAKFSTNANGLLFADECATVMEGKGWHALSIAKGKDGEFTLASNLVMDGMLSTEQVNKMANKTEFNNIKDSESLVRAFQKAIPFGAFLEDYGLINLALIHFTSFVQSAGTRVCKMKFNYQFEVRFKNILQPYKMRVPPNPPCPMPTKLIILIMSRRGAFEKRNSIRNTWANNTVNGTVIRYLIGDPPAQIDAKDVAQLRKEQSQLEDEFKLYGDIIFLIGLIDTYQNLHLKWYAALQWQRYFCAGAEFLLKTDDDTVVHLPRLDQWIGHKFRPEFMKTNVPTYFGRGIYGKRPIRDKNHKWYVSESAYPDDLYPAYLQGATYLATTQAISAVMRHAHEVDGFNMDDVLFTGILSKLANVTLFEARQHFRTGNSLGADEKCVDGIPEAISLYGAEKLTQFKEIYAKLEAIQCA